MAHPNAQDLARLRSVLDSAQQAKTNYEILQQYRPLVDAIRYALGLLERIRPGDEALMNTVLMFRLGHRRVVLAGGRVEYLVVDRHAVRASLARIDELLGPFDDD